MNRDRMKWAIGGWGLLCALGGTAYGKWLSEYQIAGVILGFVSTMGGYVIANLLEDWRRY